MGCCGCYRDSRGDSTIYCQNLTYPYINEQKRALLELKTAFAFSKLIGSDGRAVLPSDADMIRLAAEFVFED